MCLGEFSILSQSCISGICAFCKVDMKKRDYRHLEGCLHFPINAKFEKWKAEDAARKVLNVQTHQT